MFLKISKMALDKVDKQVLLKKPINQKPKFKVGDVVKVKNIPSLLPTKITHIDTISSIIKYAVWPEWHFFKGEELELYRWDVEKKDNKDKIKYFDKTENIKFYPLEAHRKNRTHGTLIELSHWFKGAEVQMKDGSIIIYVLFKLKDKYGKYQTCGNSIWVYNNENSNKTKEDILNDFEIQLYRNYRNRDKNI